MKKKRIEEMLQDCLDGYEAGLTPEECLSAYNGERAVLEPLLRQALSLRVAYANAPREEFRSEARARLMFAAGADVSRALASEPDPDFVARTRARFLQAAGASAQEALRDVPPPRLAFWINARRRLLESAAAPRPSRRFVLAMRYGLSAAVVVIALAVATLLPFTGGSPDTAGAELAILEQHITNLEKQEAVSASELLGVSKRLNAIADKLDDQPAIEVAQKLEGLTARSEALTQSAPPQPELEQAQEELDEAQAKLRVFAASVTLTTPTEVTGLAPTTPPGGDATPSPTVKPSPTPTPRPAAPGQVHTRLTDDDAYGLDWLQVTTSNVTFLIPTGWRLLNVTGDSNGVLTVNNNIIGIDTGGDPSVIIIIQPVSGETTVLIKGNPVRLRGPGPDGETIDAAQLAAAADIAGVDNEVVLALHHFVLSIDASLR